jgi:hypothetical protein
MTTFQQLSTARKRLLAAAVAVAVVGLGFGTAGFGAAAIADPLPQAPVALGVAGTFAVLSQTGVTDVPSSAVTGNVGSSPITGAAILLTCPEVTGTIFSVDAAGPACKVTNSTLLTTAVGDMGVHGRRRAHEPRLRQPRRRRDRWTHLASRPLHLEHRRVNLHRRQARRGPE